MADVEIVDLAPIPQDIAAKVLEQYYNEDCRPMTSRARPNPTPTEDFFEFLSFRGLPLVVLTMKWGKIVQIYMYHPNPFGGKLGHYGHSAPQEIKEFILRKRVLRHLAIAGPFSLKQANAEIRARIRAEIEAGA